MLSYAFWWKYLLLVKPRIFLVGLFALAFCVIKISTPPQISTVTGYDAPAPAPAAPQPQLFVKTEPAKAFPLALVTPPIPLLAPDPKPSVSQLQPGPSVPARTAAPALIPVLYQIKTSQPLIFLGIDDGVTQSSATLAWLTNQKLPFTLFLTDEEISNNYGYFAQLQGAGMSIQNHTLSHPDLNKLTLEQQTTEICGAADKYQVVYGQRPTLFRPPYGSFNDLTRQAATDCGMRAIVMWHAKVNNGSVQFQDGKTHLEPGDIVLMHFRPEFPKDIEAFTKQAKQDGLQIGRLEDWIQEVNY